MQGAKLRGELEVCHGARSSRAASSVRHGLTYLFLFDPARVVKIGWVVTTGFGLVAYTRGYAYLTATRSGETVG